MTERTYVSRNAFLAAAIAAVLTFVALVWLGRTGGRSYTSDREPSSPEKRATSEPATTQRSTTQPRLASLPVTDRWSPPPVEFVKLTRVVSLRNSRGKVVKEFPAGKRLRVSKRAGDEITINYLGDDYTIATAATEPSQ